MNVELTVENNISPSPLIVTEMTRDSTSEEHPHASVNADQASSTVMTKKVFGREYEFTFNK